MNNLGVIEGFFGPQWSQSSRLSYAAFLREWGGGFFIYAPKQDANLRKGWREKWEDDYLKHLQNLRDNFHHENILFGVGFSPFGLGSSLSPEDKASLDEKLTIINDLGIDILGLFFDDMPTNDHLARSQIEALKIIQRSFKRKIIFCPSYYTPDPILDKVFGQRPPQYLDEIANGISTEVALAWTGPKVISPEISREHMQETTSLLKRKPFLWENLFANDGPKNCKFLKLRPFTGRDNEILNEAEGIGLNLMNQPELSKILFLSSLFVLKNNMEPEEAFDRALSDLCSKGLKEIILVNRDTFLTIGLDNISADHRQNLLQGLAPLEDPAAREIEDWLNGQYIVGSECLTD